MKTLMLIKKWAFLETFIGKNLFFLKKTYTFAPNFEMILIFKLI